MADGTGVIGADAPYEDMGPPLLAAQPPSLPESLKSLADINWSEFYTHLESRRNALYSWRYSWWCYWSVLAQFFIPRRYKWLVTPNKMSRGRPINDSIIDSTGTLAVNTCASGMWTGLTSPSRPWFKFGPSLTNFELDPEGKAWLEDTAARVYSALHKSNFYAAMFQVFEDVTVFGTAPMIIYEDREDIIRCYVPCAGEYFLAAGSRFSVDTLYREFTMTVAQIVEMFRLDNCPPAVQTMWREGGGSLENEHVICHAIEPNFAIDGRAKKNRNKKLDIVSSRFVYREVYWMKGQKTDRPLSVRGFNSKPFFAARWWTVSNDAYGRSPCMVALGDNKQVQLETVRKAEFIEKGVRPPMGADVNLKNEPASILPAQITYMNAANGEKKFFPLFEVDPRWLPALQQDIAGVNNQIKDALYVNLFMAISQMEGVQPRNELELTKRDLERLQTLGPVISLFENECATQAITRALDILQRRGLLAPMPDSLKGVPLKIEYISIMRLAQKAGESVAMKDVFQTAGEMSAAAQAAHLPDPIRKLKLDKALEHYAELNNFPSSLFYTDEEVEAHDKQAAQAQAAAQAGEQAAPQALAAAKAAETLSNTQIGGGSMLNSMLTGNVQPQ